MQPRTLLSGLFALLLTCSQACAAATLLPNGEQCFQAQTGVNGMVGILGAITAGSGGTSGTYGGVSLTGGSGSGATANITVSGGAVTAVTVLNPGIQYVTGDVLSASSAAIGSTTGFSVPVASTSINSSLAGGKVYFYQPNTSIFKSTWFNADQASTHQNTNPVLLDQNGCAIVYGAGSYRQVVQDSLGNTVWDQVTTDTSANNSTFWAGISGGTPNVIAVTDPGFNGTDGSIINFTALSTNTGPATLNPSGFGAVPILKDTTGGPVSLTGGEIVQTNPISAIYRASDFAFHLLNTAIPSTKGSSAPLCGANALRIANDVSTPNSVVDLTADSAVVVSANGLALNRFTVSVTINMTINGANGLDTGSVAQATVYYIWLIDNGAASAGLASLSSSVPTMPSGYNFKCRMGAVITAAASTRLFRTSQKGQFTDYVGTDSFKVIASGALGSSCGSATPNYSPTTYNGAGTVVPLTASEVRVIASNGYNSGSIATVLFAPNSSYTGIVGLVPPPIGLINLAGVTLSQSATVLFESQSFFYCSSDTGGAVGMMGWRDSVNAN